MDDPLDNDALFGISSVNKSHLLLSEPKQLIWGMVLCQPHAHNLMASKWAGGGGKGKVHSIICIRRLNVLLLHDKKKAKDLTYQWPKWESAPAPIYESIMDQLSLPSPWKNCASKAALKHQLHKVELVQKAWSADLS